LRLRICKSRCCLSFFKSLGDLGGHRLVRRAVLSSGQHHDDCLPVSANRGGNEDSGPGGRGHFESLRRRVRLAQDEDAKRHSCNGANELRDNPAGK
jgi:hypothetical protein